MDPSANQWLVALIERPPMIDLAQFSTEIRKGDALLYSACRELLENMPKLACNGFSLFADFVWPSLEEKEKRCYGNFSEVLEAAAPYWEKISEDDQHAWKEKAKSMKRLYDKPVQLVYTNYAHAAGGGNMGRGGGGTGANRTNKQQAKGTYFTTGRWKHKGPSCDEVESMASDPDCDDELPGPVKERNALDQKEKLFHCLPGGDFSWHKKDISPCELGEMMMSLGPLQKRNSGRDDTDDEDDALTSGASSGGRTSSTRDSCATTDGTSRSHYMSSDNAAISSVVKHDKRTNKFATTTTTTIDQVRVITRTTVPGRVNHGGYCQKHHGINGNSSGCTNTRSVAQLEQRSATSSGAVVVHASSMVPPRSTYDGSGNGARLSRVHHAIKYPHYPGNQVTRQPVGQESWRKQRDGHPSESDRPRPNLAVHSRRWERVGTVDKPSVNANVYKTSPKFTKHTDSAAHDSTPSVSTDDASTKGDVVPSSVDAGKDSRKLLKETSDL